MLLDSKHEHWLSLALEDVRYLGYAVIDNVLDPAFLLAVKDAMYGVQRRITESLGDSRLRRAGETGVLRIMMLYSPIFFKFLELRPLLDIIDSTVSTTAIMHLQNGFILPPAAAAAPPAQFQNTFHQDFPRVLHGALVSINVFFAIDEFTEGNGATLVAPGTHQKQERPSVEYLQCRSRPIVCPAGSMIVFDSTLWHAAGANQSQANRLGINHQFTRSYIKQQIDYPRALGSVLIEALPERSQQLLGWFTRVPASHEEFYREDSARLYRRGQG